MKPLTFGLFAAITSLALLSASTSRADDRATIDRTQIIGNRELPKVLYIVPWKKPGVPGLADPSVIPPAGQLPGQVHKCRRQQG